LICPPPRRSFDLLQAKAFPLDDLGMWPKLHGAGSDKVLMRNLQQGLLANYGTAFRAFTADSVDVVQRNDGFLDQAMQALRDTFYAQLAPDADGQVVTNGKPVLPRRCSDILLALLLKAYRQERYRERASVDMYLTDDLTALCSRSRLVPQSK